MLFFGVFGRCEQYTQTKCNPPTARVGDLLFTFELKMMLVQQMIRPGGQGVNRRVDSSLGIRVGPGGSFVPKPDRAKYPKHRFNVTFVPVSAAQRQCTRRLVCEGMGSCRLWGGVGSAATRPSYMYNITCDFVACCSDGGLTGGTELFKHRRSCLWLAV